MNDQDEIKARRTRGLWQVVPIISRERGAYPCPPQNQSPITTNQNVQMKKRTQYANQQPASSIQHCVGQRWSGESSECSMQRMTALVSDYEWWSEKVVNFSDGHPL